MRYASMWPRFRKRGNHVLVKSLPIPLQLQCGRAFESAEIGKCLTDGTCLPALQCGRAFESAEILRAGRGPWAPGRFNVAALSKARKSRPGRTMDPAATRFNVAALSKARKSQCTSSPACAAFLLQCGRAFESAEIGGVWHGGEWQNGASMWPRFRKRGNSLRPLACAPRWMPLQCGRAFESAEIRFLDDPLRRPRRFNVAALSKARKWAVPADSVRGLTGLQCGRAFESAEIKSR